jgi:hypothetical protein
MPLVRSALAGRRGCFANLLGRAVSRALVVVRLVTCPLWLTVSLSLGRFRPPRWLSGGGEVW